MADSRAVNFPETSYGIVKRLQTIEAWTAGVAQRLGTPSLSILDFGCGTGDHVTYPLACLGHRVLGVDMHEPSIQEAQRRYPLPNLLFRTGHLESLIQEGVAADLKKKKKKEKQKRKKKRRKKKRFKSPRTSPAATRLSQPHAASVEAERGVNHYHPQRLWIV